MTSDEVDKAERKRLKKLRRQQEAAAAAADEQPEEAAEEQSGEKKKKKKKKNRDADDEAAAGDDGDAAEAAEEQPRKKSKKGKQAAEEAGDAEMGEDDDGAEKKTKKKKSKENPDAAFVAFSRDKVAVGDKAAAAAGGKIKKEFYKEHPEVSKMAQEVSSPRLRDLELLLWKMCRPPSGMAVRWRAGRLTRACACRTWRPSAPSCRSLWSPRTASCTGPSRSSSTPASRQASWSLASASDAAAVCDRRSLDAAHSDQSRLLAGRSRSRPRSSRSAGRSSSPVRS